jgi:hypothetical protein
MAKTQTRPWDVAEHLKTEEDMALYLEAALEEADPAAGSSRLGGYCPCQGDGPDSPKSGYGTRKPL